MLQPTFTINVELVSLQHGRPLSLGVSLTVQVEVHPHFRNERLRQWCMEQNIHVTAYGPLSSPGTMLSMGKSLPNLMRVSMLGTNDTALTCQTREAAHQDHQPLRWLDVFEKPMVS